MHADTGEIFDRSCESHGAPEVRVSIRHEFEAEMTATVPNKIS